MNLDNEKELFEQIIIGASRKLNIDVAIIEKDYYVTKILKMLVEAEPNIIFKGGTSLSKCYKLIDRFSEDIDLNYDNQGKNITARKRKEISKLIKEVGDKMGVELTNPDDLRSGRDFNRYIFDYHADYVVGAVKTSLIVEMAMMTNSFPTEVVNADSYIYQFLFGEGMEDIIEEYNIEPFAVSVQTKERTFVDKIFAICDYYMSNKVTEHSRHLYDLYKLYPYIKNDEKLAQLVVEVRKARANSKVCLSARAGCVLTEILERIIEDAIYKGDYQEITQVLLFEKVEYERVIDNLRLIALMNIWDEKPEVG